MPNLATFNINRFLCSIFIKFNVYTFLCAIIIRFIVDRYVLVIN